MFFGRTTPPHLCFNENVLEKIDSQKELGSLLAAIYRGNRRGSKQCKQILIYA